MAWKPRNVSQKWTLPSFVLGRLTTPQDEHDEEQAAFTRLAEGLLSPELSDVYLSHGVRPIAETAGAAVRPPPTVPGLRIVGSPGTPPGSPPTRRLLRTIRKRARTLKKSADVCLVLDVSGSMSGHRLAAAKRGLLLFLDRLAGPDANASAIFFADRVWTPVALQPLPAARTAVRQELARVDAGGATALLDGVHQALDMLDGAGTAQNLKAMIVLTDGEENSSFRTLGDVERRLDNSGYLFFGIAYGGAAGRALLETLARRSGGHSLVTDEDGIETAYELLSQHM